MNSDFQNMKYFLDMMATQKVIEYDRDAFRLTPSFAAILVSQFKNHGGSAAAGLALAVKSYCNPGTTNSELAVISTGVMTMLRLSENPMFHEVKAQLDRDIPPGMVMPKNASLQNIIDMVDRDKNKTPCTCDNPHTFHGSNQCINCAGVIDRSDLA